MLVTIFYILKSLMSMFWNFILSSLKCCVLQDVGNHGSPILSVVHSTQQAGRCPSVSHYFHYSIHILLPQPTPWSFSFYLVCQTHILQLPRPPNVSRDWHLWLSSQLLCPFLPPQVHLHFFSSLSKNTQHSSHNHIFIVISLNSSYASDLYRRVDQTYF